jgi:hypothetical protein
MSLISRGEFFVFVYKDGLLSRLGHDLRLRLDRFEVEVDGSQLLGRFDPKTLHVDTAMRDGVPRPGELSDKDRREIEKNIADRVLQVAKYPEVRFEGDVISSEASDVRVSGTLTLMGHSESMALEVHRRSGLLEAETTLIPSRWGIKPYKALMGALRIQDRVGIRFSLPEPGDD